jgi:hypothetical protein
MTTQPHYPTSEELAKLRFGFSECRHQQTGEAHDRCPLSHPKDGGAWPWEAETTGGNGIGYRGPVCGLGTGAVDCDCCEPGLDGAALARAGAAAMRSRAYAFMAANVPDLEA